MNLYASQFYANRAQQQQSSQLVAERSHQAPWRDVTVDEIKQFCDLLFVMRLNPKPRLSLF